VEKRMTEAEQNTEVDLARIAEEAHQRILVDNADDPVVLIEQVYKLWWHWADFELVIISPTIPLISPPTIHHSEALPDSNELEHVYSIHDYGYRLATSKSEDMYTAGMSMCKMFYTIEKMIYLLVERLKTSGIDTETEVQIAFGGHEIAQRKAFESIINLIFNVVVTNFDPGPWGERYLQTVKRIADKGYGYPPEAPRDSFRQSHGTIPTMLR
jgi:hypothetical protein